MNRSEKRIIDKKWIILVADDESRFRKSLVDALKFFDYEVQEAQNGDELNKNVTSLIETDSRFILLVDNQMPEKSGESEKQWCGLEHILKLCEEHSDVDFGKRVLFLSRWGLEDLPEDIKEKVKSFGLLKEDSWLNVYTPFPIIKSRIEKLTTNSL